jgi:signal transduction histidine kinase
VAINKSRLLFAFAAFLTAITLALTGLAAYVIERQSEADAFHRLSQQLMQLQDDLQSARELLLVVAREATRDDKNLTDMAILYSQSLQLETDHTEIGGRALNAQKEASANRLRLILGSARLSGVAVYLDGELSHYVLSEETGKRRTELIAPRLAAVNRVTAVCSFPTGDLMALRVIVPIQAVLRESFNQTIAEDLQVATPDSVHPHHHEGPAPRVIGMFVFSKAFDIQFLQNVANSTGVFPALISAEGTHHLQLITLHVPQEFLLANDDAPVRLATEQIGPSSYYEALKRWRVDEDNGLILGAAVSRAGTLANVKQTLMIVTAAAGLILSLGMAIGYHWISRTVTSLEQQVREATAQLQAANKELEAFSYSVSHDLRAPLRSVDGFSRALLEDYEHVLGGSGPDYLRRIRAASQHMGQLIDDMLNLAHMSRIDLQRIPVDLTAIARNVSDELRNTEPHRCADIVIQPNLRAKGDPRLLRVLLHNLMHNAWKFTSKRDSARIEFGQMSRNGTAAYYVRDDGVGFEMAYAHKLFGAFQRLHTTAEFPGTGVGLATVQRVVHRHGGRVWAESEPGHGATFFFTLPDEPLT